MLVILLMATSTASETEPSVSATTVATPTAATVTSSLLDELANFDAATLPEDLKERARQLRQKCEDQLQGGARVHPFRISEGSKPGKGCATCRVFPDYQMDAGEGRKFLANWWNRHLLKMQGGKEEPPPQSAAALPPQPAAMASSQPSAVLPSQSAVLSPQPSVTPTPQPAAVPPSQPSAVPLSQPSAVSPPQHSATPTPQPAVVPLSQLSPTSSLQPPTELACRPSTTDMYEWLARRDAANLPFVWS